MDIPGQSQDIHPVMHVCRGKDVVTSGGHIHCRSVVMTAVVTARLLDVRLWCWLSPRPAPITLAAAYISGAGYFFLCVGGAQRATMAWDCGR
jgi:histidinol dehydrogenase